GLAGEAAVRALTSTGAVRGNDHAERASVRPEARPRLSFPPPARSIYQIEERLPGQHRFARDVAFLRRVEDFPKDVALEEAGSMGHRVRGAHLFVALLALAPACCQGSRSEEGPKTGKQPAPELTAEAQKAAQRLVENDRRFKELFGEKERSFLVEKVRGNIDPKDKVYFTKA